MSDTQTYDLEAVFHVVDNRNGVSVSVGPDQDALGLVQITHNDTGTLTSIIVPVGMAEQLSQALWLYLEHVKNEEKRNA